MKPARSDNREVGLKYAHADWKATLAAFDIHNENELAVQANSGGRSVYENIGPTRRRGTELALTLPVARHLSATLAGTLIDARTEADYRACAGIPCVPVTVQEFSNFTNQGGNALPTVDGNLAPDEIERLHAIGTLIDAGDLRVPDELGHAGMDALLVQDDAVDEGGFEHGETGSHLASVRWFAEATAPAGDPPGWRAGLVIAGRR